MGDFRRDEEFRPRRRESGFRNEDFDRDKPAPRKHKTTCDKCGKDCEVPFKPTGNKPVLCSDCFRKAERYGPRAEFGSRSDAPASSGISPKDLREINQKLDKIIKALNIEEP